MSPNASALATLVGESVRRPRAAMRAVLAIEVEAPLLWQALVLVAVAGAIIVWVGLLITPDGRMLLSDGAFPGPVFLAMVQFAFLSVMVPLIARIGRSFGGTGDGTGALKVVIWWQVVGLSLQLAELVLELLLPGAADLAGFALMALMFWLLASFIAEMHGIASTGATLVGIIGAFLAIGLVSSLLLTALGVTIIGGP